MKKIEKKFLGKSLQISLRNDADRSVYSEIFEDLDYKIVEKYIKNAKNCIIDIGAHIGLFSIYAAILNPNVKIFCFEPEPENFNLLKKHLKDNRIQNVIPKNIAITGKTGQTELFLSEDSHNHSITKKSQKKIKVPCSDLKKIILKLQKQNIPFIDLLKIDAEGAEFPILRGLDNITSKLIQKIYIEYHEFNNIETKEYLKNLLTNKGFCVKITPSHYQSNLGFLLAKK